MRWTKNTINFYTHRETHTYTHETQTIAALLVQKTLIPLFRINIIIKT